MIRALLRTVYRFVGIAVWLLAATDSLGQSVEKLRAAGLRQTVDIRRDRWGIAHIYAQNEHDLFFAQGYMAATDRLFQLELWRRQATGTVAELLGPQELKRDIGLRLFRYRGNMDAELKQYHPRGPQIVRAFVEGINARIRQVRQTPGQLPFEFQILKTLPGYWTPEVVVSRHQGLLSNVRDELNYGRLVHLLGAEGVRQRLWFEPKRTDNEPDLTLHIDGEALFEPILELYEAFKLPLKLSPTDKTSFDAADWFEAEKQFVGSNNWVVSGRRSASGQPMLANDPHRAQSVPSLRYWTHLNAPGWHVIGAGEPTLPGISIGHNEYGAWGLTIFDTDNEDLLVYELNPANPRQYRYKGRWETVRILRETIPVKGQSAVPVELRYTRHGPVVYEDKKRNLLYVVRAGWLDAGGAPYLASLRMNQARNWSEFRQACARNHIPGENMIWAERGTRAAPGTIGWQAAGLAPVRPNWTGLVPVPGDGRFEWAGYLPIEKLPHKVNPPEGYVVTANNNLTPPDFPYRNAVGWVWSAPTRANRIREVLTSRETHTLADFGALQADYLSNPARTLVPLLLPLKATDEPTEWARQRLLDWDFQLNPESVAAAIYAAWETRLRQELYGRAVPESARPFLRSIPTMRVLDWLTHPERMPSFGSDGIHTEHGQQRDSLLVRSLRRAVADLEQRLGPDRTRWHYGQPRSKHIALRHLLTDRLTPDQQARVNLGPLPRGGYGETVNNTGGNLNQEHGASFRILVDTADWDQTLGINNPGQSADPDSPYYRNLFELWAKNGYFPVYFSREKIESVTERRLRLMP